MGVVGTVCAGWESSQQELDEPDLEKRRILISLEGSTEFDNLRYGSYLTMTKLI